MMLVLGIIMIYLTGAAVLLRFGRDWSWKETISFSFLLGIAIETFFMFLCDCFNLQFSNLVLFFLSFAVIATSYDLLYEYYLLKRKDINLGDWSLSTLNYPAVLLGSFILLLFYVITAKNLYWPTTEHDAIGSFDKLGIAMSLEGKIRISLFDYDLQGAGGVYPPLFHGGIAYLYLFGAIQPKIITTLFYLSLLLGFYSFLRKHTSTISALFFTLLLELTPELYSHAALLLGNLPTTAYVGLSALALFEWWRNGDRKYFWLALALNALTLWIRNDTIGFVFASLVLVFLKWRKEKDGGLNWKSMAIYAILSFAPLVIWTIYLNLKLHADTAGKFSFHFIGDGQKLKLMLAYVFSYISWFQVGTMPPGIMLYGLSFLLPIVVILLNFKNLKKDSFYILIYTALSFSIYFLVFLLLDEQKQGSPIWSLMESSFKRGMFCFIPPLLYYAGTTTLVQRLFNGLEKFRLGR